MMLFLPAPFDAAEVVEGLGIGAADAGRPAVLDGWRMGVTGDGMHLAPVPQAGGAVAGSVFRVALRETARPGFVFSVLGAPLRHAVVGTEAGAVEALVPVAGAPGAFPGCADAGALDAPERVVFVAEMVREIAGRFGTVAARDLAAFRHGVGFRALARMRGRLADAGADGIRSPMTAADVETQSVSYPYGRYFAVEEHVLTHRRFDGGRSPAVSRAVLASGDAVTVLPWDPETDAVLLVEQFRAGPAARRDRRPWSVEAIAGRCDGFESYEAAARREAAEEAGIALERLERVAGYYPSPGASAEYIVSFVAAADLGAAGGVFGLRDEHEDIRAFVVAREAAMTAVTRGEIDNAPLVLTLLWLALNGERLRSRWGLLDGKGGTR